MMEKVLGTVLVKKFNMFPKKKRKELVMNNVGYKHFSIPYQGKLFPVDVERNVSLVTALWYPTDRSMQNTTYSSGFDQIETVLATDARPLKGPFPLVVYLHGAFGWAIKGAYLAEYLASRGFVVAGIDFVDYQPPNFTTEMYAGRILGDEGKQSGIVVPGIKILKQTPIFLDWMDANPDDALSWFLNGRITTTTHVINYLSNLSGKFSNLIDLSKIGVMGTSAGGVSVLGISGAHPNPNALDSRVKASLAFTAPVVKGMENRFSDINVPLFLIVGDNDEQARNDGSNRKDIFEGAKSPRLFYVLKNATHFSFGTPSSSELAGVTLPAYVASNNQKNNLCSITKSFFDVYLNSKSTTCLTNPNNEIWKSASWELTPGGLVEWPE